MRPSEIVQVGRTNNNWGGIKKLNEYRRKKVKAFHLLSTGMDHFPVKEAMDMGFIVRNTYYESEKAVSPFSFELLAELNRKVYDDYLIEYSGKDALIIGSEGCIGKKVCKIASAYEMNILDFDISNPNDSPERLLKWISRAKFIFFCCDLNPSSADYFRAKQYNAMKETPLIINSVGRLGLLDLNRLQYFINKGNVAGYACDQIPKHTIKNNLNCVFTDHIGWKTGEAFDRRESAQQKVYEELLRV